MTPPIPQHRDPSWSQATLAHHAADSGATQYGPLEFLLTIIAMGLAFAFQVRLFWVGFPAYSVGCLYIALGFHVVAVLAYFPLVILAGSTYSEDAGRGIQVALTAAFAIFSTVIAVIQLIATFILILSSGLRRVANVCNLHDELKGCGEELAELRPLTDVEANALADLYQAVGALCQGVLDGKLDRTGWLSLWWCWKARVMKRRLKENITAFTTEIVLARPSEFQWERTGNEKACLVD